MGGSSTTNSSSQPPANFLSAYNALMGQATGVANQPLQQYTGDTVAGLSPDQQAAIGTIQNSQGIANPYINAAASQFGQATAPLSTNAPQIAGQYGNQATGAAQQAGNAGIAATNLGGQAAWDAANRAGNAGIAATNLGGQAGWGAVNQYGNAATGIAGTAAGTANQAAGTNVWGQLSPLTSQINQYESPYQQQVVGATQAEFANQNAQQNQGIVGNAISSGAWGGDRASVAQGIAAGQEQLAQAPVIAGLENTGYAQALQTAQQQQGLQASLGQSQAQLEAQTALGAGQLGTSANLGAGQMIGNQATQNSQLALQAALQSGQLEAGTAEQNSQLGLNAALGAGNLGVNAAGTAGNLGIAGQGQELSAEQAQAWLNMQAGSGLAGLGNEAQQTTLTGANAQMGAGQTEQALEQAQLNVPYQQFEQQQAYPFQTTQWLTSLIQGLGSSAGGSSSTTVPGPNPFSEVIGGLGALGSFASLLARGGSVRRATGGGIAPPDVSISYVPEAGGTSKGGGPPKPPNPQQEADPLAGIGAAAAGLGEGVDTFKRHHGIGAPAGFVSPGATAGLGDVSDPMGMLASENPNFSFDGATTAARRGGGIGKYAGGGVPKFIRHLASGGASGNPDFVDSLMTANGISIPQLSTAAKASPGIAANLTKDYGSNPVNADGTSSLPSATYKPPVAPWTTPSADTAASAYQSFIDQLLAGLPGMKRGGIAKFADGGDADDDDATYYPGAYDDDGHSAAPGIAAGAWVPPPQAKSPVPIFRSDAEPRAAKMASANGDGIALDDVTPDRYVPDYTPRQARTADEEPESKNAGKYGLLAASLGIMAGRSPYAMENIGAGGLEGLKLYESLKGKAADRAEREEEEEDKDTWTQANATAMAAKASDTINTTRAGIKQREQAETDANTAREQAEKDRVANEKAQRDLQGQDWEFARPDKNDPTKGTWVNKKDPTQTRQGPAKVSAIGDQVISDDDAMFAAHQLNAGDTSALSDWGMGAAGTTNRVKIREAFTKLEESLGKSGEDVAAKNAEFFGTKAGERTLGTRTANIEMAVNEASNMGVLARQASSQVPRGSWKPINAVLNFYRTNTGDPATRAFGASLNSYLNAYATAVGKGTMTVDARNHAEQMLGTADGPRAFGAVMDQLDKEMQAARAAPGQVRGAMRNAVTGNEGVAAPAVPPDAIAHLKANPTLAPAFDAKYGVGTSKQYLGGP